MQEQEMACWGEPHSPDYVAPDDLTEPFHPGLRYLALAAIIIVLLGLLWLW